MLNSALTRFSGTRKVEEKPTSDHQAAWNKKHIDRHAGDVRAALFGFKYIVEVRWRKIFTADYDHTHTNPPWKLVDEFVTEYTYPFRELGEHSVIMEMRGVYDGRRLFVRNEFGGDGVFVGTNNTADAVMIKLKYS